MKKSSKEDLPLSMAWEDLIFINFPCDPHRLQKLLPPGMEVDTFEGKGYITVAPLTMKDFSWNGFKAIFNPSFYECNLRTYVKVQEKTGVYFFSLDASSFFEVFGARALFHLNYRFRRIKFSFQKDSYLFQMSSPYSSKKRTIIQARISSEKAVNDPLTEFISDRESYFVLNKSHIYEGNVKHPPWKFQKVEDIKLETDLFKDLKSGIDLKTIAPVLAVYAKKTVVSANFIKPAFYPIVFFDKTCGLCSLAVRTLLFLDRSHFLRFAPLEGKTYYQYFDKPPKKDRILLKQDTGTNDGADALLKLLDYLPWFTGIFAVFKLIPLKTLNRWYDWVAKKRKNCPLKVKKIGDSRLLP